MIPGKAFSNSALPASGLASDGLEPILRAVEDRLSVHRERGDIGEGHDLRSAAILLVSPILLTYAHQAPLGGARQHPTDLRDLARQTARCLTQVLGQSTDARKLTDLHRS